MQNSGALCKFLAIAFIPYLAVGAMDGSINLVPNPSFEYTFTTETVGKVPLYWSRFSGAQSTIDLNSDSVQGDFGLTLTDGGTSLSAGILSDIIVVEPDQVYQASCWCKRGSTAARPQMILQFVDAAGNEIKQLSTMVGAVGVWAESDITFTVPSGVSRLRMLLYSTLASVGTTSFDCVSLVLAEQRVSDGGFDGARIGLLPEHWTSAYKPEGVRQSVERDSGVSNHGLIVMLGGGGSQQEMNKSLCLYDASSSTSCGVWRKVAPLRMCPISSQPQCAKRMVRAVLRFTSSFTTHAMSKLRHFPPQPPQKSIPLCRLQGSRLLKPLMPAFSVILTVRLQVQRILMIYRLRRTTHYAMPHHCRWVTDRARTR